MNSFIVGMEWKDATSYIRGQVDRTPDTFSAQCGPMRLVVTSGHIYYPGKWVAHAFPLFENKTLTATTREEAQDEVVQMVRDWLSAAAAGLAAAKVNPNITREIVENEK